MQEKQNYKYVLDRIYPEYAKNIKDIQKQKSSQKLFGNHENKKIERKLKMIIDSLEKQLEQDAENKQKQIINRYEDRYGVSSKASMRSYSLKFFKGTDGYSQRFQTEPEHEENIQNMYISKNVKMGSQKNILNKRQVLQLPRIMKKHSKINSFREPKNSQSKKRYQIMKQINEKQQLLGRIVLQKVEKHFKDQKIGRKKYFERVKSVQDIDDTFVCHLKNKIYKASNVLSK